MFSERELRGAAVAVQGGVARRARDGLGVHSHGVVSHASGFERVVAALLGAVHGELDELEVRLEIVPGNCPRGRRLDGRDHLGRDVVPDLDRLVAPGHGERVVWRDGPMRWCTVGSGRGRARRGRQTRRRDGNAREASGRALRSVLVSASSQTFQNRGPHPLSALPRTPRTQTRESNMDDPELKAKARDVFTALTANGASFTEFLDADFSAWRVFFRGLKELSNDQTSALGELAAGSFLGRNDIMMSNWGKSVKERSELFKEEFDRFIGLPEVRGALAKDLGMASQAPPASPLAAMRAAASREASPQKKRRTQGTPRMTRRGTRGTEHSPARAIDGGNGRGASAHHHGSHHPKPPSPPPSRPGRRCPRR